MATIDITIPDEIASELETIAQGNGYPLAKDMMIDYVRAQIRAYRGRMALEGVRESAEVQADLDTASIS